MEFINESLLRWCLQRHIEAARTRPYHKNDNCYAEQKNYDAVKTIGSFRFDTAEACAALAEVNRRLNEAVEKLLKLNREKGYTGKDPCQGEVQAAVA